MLVENDPTSWIQNLFLSYSFVFVLRGSLGQCLLVASCKSSSFWKNSLFPLLLPSLEPPQKTIQNKSYIKSQLLGTYKGLLAPPFVAFSQGEVMLGYA